MAQANTPRLIGTAPEPYDGQGNKALAFWNILENYFMVNEDTFDTDHKKVASALTYFKQDTQAGEWASDKMATAIAAQPTNYGTWQAFKDAFKAQFIPPQTELEALAKLHDTPQGDREFNEWYQEWSQHACRANVGANTLMFTFRNALNEGINNQIASQSPQPATLAELVERARDLDRYWRMYAKPSNKDSHRISEISVNDSYTEINATQSSPYETPIQYKRLTSEQRHFRKENHLCFYCGKSGHSAGSCPTAANKKCSCSSKIQQVFPVKEDYEEMDQLEVPSFSASPL